MFFVFFFVIFYFTHLKIRPNEMRPPPCLSSFCVSKFWYLSMPVSLILDWTTNRRQGSTNLLSRMLTLYFLLHFILSWSQGGLQRSSTKVTLAHQIWLLFPKGSPPIPKLMFFYTLRKRPFSQTAIQPPPPPSLQCFFYYHQLYNSTPRMGSLAVILLLFSTGLSSKNCPAS